LLIPLTFRFMRAEFFGIGFGPYALFRSGSEFGLRASLRGEIPAFSSVKALFDFSYQFAFTDSDPRPNAETKSQELAFLLGFRVPVAALSGSEPSLSNDGAKR